MRCVIFWIRKLLYLQKECFILQNVVNTGSGSLQDFVSARIKREAGGSPARSRHCKRRADPLYAIDDLKIIEKVGKALTRKSGDLPGSSVHAARKQWRNRNIFLMRSKTGTALCCLFLLFSGILFHVLSALSPADAAVLCENLRCDAVHESHGFVRKEKRLTA